MLVAIWLPSIDVAVIDASPGDIPFIFPFESTVTIPVLLLFQVIFLFVALLGVYVTLMLFVSPSLMLTFCCIDIFFNDIVTLLTTVGLVNNV